MNLDHSISKRIEDPELRVLSLGAGVQSSVMLLMALDGAFGDLPDAVIFADTQFEPVGVYDHLQFLRGEISRRSNRLEIIDVTAGDIRADQLNQRNTTGGRFAAVPFYMKGGAGMGRRQCTREYKIDPITKGIRQLLGLEKHKKHQGRPVELWIGLSTDELQRLAEHRIKWIRARWPLLEARMSRTDCRAWFAARYDRPLVKSACVFCPFRTDAEWRDMKINDPETFELACVSDEEIREAGTSGMVEQQFIHRSCKPLREVSFTGDGTVDMFEGECEGMCGL